MKLSDQLRISTIKTRIDWTQANIEFITIDQYWQLQQELEDICAPLPNKARYESDFLKWTEIGTWSCGTSNAGWSRIRVRRNDGFYEYRCYLSNDEKNQSRKDNEISGLQAYTFVDELFFERTGLSLMQAFGRSERIEWQEWIPSPIIQVMYPDLSGRVISSCYKADYSSAYPFCMCGALPDVRSAVTEYAELEPTAEYPFCFYSDGSSAEYNGYDLRKVKYHVLNKNRWSQEGDCIIWTTRMKKSEYTIEPELRHFYEEKRNGNTEAKAIMNKLIGFFQNKKNFSGIQLAILAAVGLSRHVYNMCVTYDDLTNNGNKVLSIATDCFVWQGTNSLNLDETKELGKLVLEHENALFAIRSNGNYYVQDKNGCYKYKHQGKQDDPDRYKNIYEYLAQDDSETILIPTDDGRIEERTYNIITGVEKK